MSQLENLLVAIAEVCPEHGMTILHRLFGFSTSNMSGLQFQDRAEVPFSFSLLSRLCQPISEVNKERYLCMQLRMYNIHVDRIWERSVSLLVKFAPVANNL